MYAADVEQYLRGSLLCVNLGEFLEGLVAVAALPRLDRSVPQGQGLYRRLRHPCVLLCCKPKHKLKTGFSHSTKNGSCETTQSFKSLVEKSWVIELEPFLCSEN